jgi:transposase InsO family protein
MNHKFGVERMCKTLGVSRSGYYDWMGRKKSIREIEREKYARLIHQIYRASKGRYGSPKITQELNKQGYPISRPRVARIMKAECLRSITYRKFRVTTTDSKHTLPITENKLNQDFKADRPAQKWVSDITYIRITSGWSYLTMIMDLYDRKIIGWSLSRDLTIRNTILPAWYMATRNRPVVTADNLIFHSDRGIQYASNEFRGLLKRFKVNQSMSRKGNYYDNAVAENFFRILKTELIRQQPVKNYERTKLDLFEYIEGWYNRKRLHSYLGYQTPEQFGKINYLKTA